MMMWSVVLTGSKPCTVPSREVIQAVRDLRSLQEPSEKTETVSDSLSAYSQGIPLVNYPHGVSGAWKPVKRLATTKGKWTISKLATWLLKQVISGA
jgi:hypothetical protein